MFASVVGDCIHVRLSRHNVRQLGAILEAQDGRNRYLARKGDGGPSIIVQIEDDADHYKTRETSPNSAPPAPASRNDQPWSSAAVLT